MKIRIYGNETVEAVRAARGLVERLAHTVTECTACDVAIAPLLTRKLSENEINAPRFGTLIFHPSPLPYGRGMSAIRWAYRRKEPVTAATWFWANDRLDAGDICEQEIVRIDYDLRPREFYALHVIPAMTRTLERALIDLAAGRKRAVKQVEEYATYDSKIE
jgi:methionyl-tRNA formyltransferase